MKRIVLPLMLLAAIPARADEASDRKQTIDYVRSLQTEDGGFRGAAKAPPSLRATSAGVRALHYLGGQVPSRDAAAKFVASCFDDTTGGFADSPGGKVDVFSTSVGLMAVVELKLPTERFAGPGTRYLSKNAVGFEDIRIAVAGFEAAEIPTSSVKWMDAVTEKMSPDGTFGSGAGKARDTGGAVVALMRMGLKFPRPDPILAALRDGQRPDGGFGKADAGSDLESSYRIMRCFWMLKARPSRVEDLRSFVAKCRNADGGYGVAPGQPSNVGGTYYAAIIQHWLEKK